MSIAIAWLVLVPALVGGVWLMRWPAHWPSRVPMVWQRRLPWLGIALIALALVGFLVLGGYHPEEYD